MSTAPSRGASPTPTLPSATNTTSPSPPSNSAPPPTTTPSTSPPPPSDAKTSPSPATQSSPSTPSPPSSTSSPPKSSSSLSTPTGVFVGIAVGAVAIILGLSNLWFCSGKKKRRHGQHYAPPQGPKDQGRNTATHQTDYSYDFFLSFCGPDTRHSFTGSLYHALTSMGYKVFMDDQTMQPGDRISQALVDAIQKSRISIIVLSQNYASSTWCLDELVEILECMGLKKQLVWPIFYRVRPSDVREQRNSYAEAIAKHEKIFGVGSDEVQKWRSALTEVAGVEGWPDTTGRYDHELIEEIVKKARTTLKREQLDVGEHIIGHQSRIEEVKSRLDIESDQKVCMLGIHGTGGMGKTALAKALYNLINHQFEIAIFLEDVREKSNSSMGLVHLQEKILSKLEDKEIKLGGASEGVPRLKGILQHHRVLLVLDDVDKEDQLESLAGDCNWFRSGSRIIITTRDTHVLDRRKVEKRFEMKVLNDDEALELFCWKAFNNSQPPMNYKEVSQHFVQYAGGLPLALKVIGSHLASKKSVKAFEDALKQYKKIPDREIQKVLGISYESLEDHAKNIFLDIAFFFKGKSLGYAEQLWEKCDFSPSYNIEILVDKSLITIENGVLRMHDLIQDMGKEKVRLEDPENPGRRSRLCFHQDALKVLRENSGSDRIKGIMLDPPEEKEVNWNDNAFKKMTNLRILIIRKTHFLPELDCLSNSLQLLDWEEYPSKSLPSGFDQIVDLNLPHSHLTLEEAKPCQKLVHLTRCNFSSCKYITHLPDVSGVPNLSELYLNKCRSLTAVHHSVGFLQNLKLLDASDCEKLKDLPPRMSLPSLERLDLSNTSIASFPDVSGVPNLSALMLFDCRNLIAIHHSVGFLQNLKSLCASYCEKLIDIPPVMSLPSLELLDLGNTSIEFLPHIEGMMCAPLSIYLDYCLIKELPVSISNLVGLKLIRMFCGNVAVGGLPSELFMLPNMSELSLCYSGAAVGESIRRLLNSHAMATTGPSTLNKPPYSPLIKFTCSDCGLTDEHLDIILSCFPNLQELDISSNEFVSLPASINGSAKLRCLNVSHCLMLEEIPELPKSISYVDANGCPRLSSEAFETLWSQVSNEVYGVHVVMPRLTEIPDWFDHHCKGGILSFQARRKFPVLAVAAIVEEHAYFYGIHLYINGKLCKTGSLPSSATSVCIFELRSLFLNEEWSSLDTFLVYEWNHVEIVAGCYLNERTTINHHASNEVYGLRVVMPRLTEILDWFDHHCEGGIVSFQARRKFPVLAITFILEEYAWIQSICLYINGDFCKRSHLQLYLGDASILDFQGLFYNQEWSSLDTFLVHEWNHVEIKFDYYYDGRSCNNFNASSFGAYVYKQQTNMEDIRFTCPNPSKKTLSIVDEDSPKRKCSEEAQA